MRKRVLYVEWHVVMTYYYLLLRIIDLIAIHGNCNNDVINRLSAQGALTNNHSRLFSQEYYSFSPLIDADKFTNYTDYYWVFLAYKKSIVY